MSIFDRSFLITTVITAVICGAIYYYFHMKMVEFERALVKQNQVLSSFIANVQQEFRTMTRGTAIGGGVTDPINISNELASEEAIAAVKALEHKKIVISDSTYEDSTEDSAEESDEDSVSDNDEIMTNTNLDNKLVICDMSRDDTKKNDMKFIVMSSLGITNLYTPEKYIPDTYTSNITNVVDNSDSDSDSESETDIESECEEYKCRIMSDITTLNDLPVEEINIDQLPDFAQTLSAEPLSTVDSTSVELTSVELTSAELTSVEPIISVEPTTSVEPISVEPTTNYDDLKVSDLRKLALGKQLVHKDEAKNLKKNELLAVLKKHIDTTHF